MKVISFTTERRHGNAREPQALERFLRDRKYPGHPATAEQVHGIELKIVPRLASSRRYARADGLLTDISRQPLGIFTADCLPVFIAAPRAGVVGVLHAGWRGLKDGILPSAVRVLRQRWGIRSAEINIWSGPAIGFCCFEVGWDVARHFPRARKRFKDRWRVDLQGSLREQAQALGAHFRSTAAARRCTMHGPYYYSHRRDAMLDRQVSVIIKE